MFILRRYQPGEAPVLAQIFEAAVRGTARRDYTAAQIDAWAASAPAIAGRDEWFCRLYTVVAEQDGRPVGYGNIDPCGYLDHLFVHPAAGGQGIGSALCEQLESWAAAQGIRTATVHASKTARPLFERRGWQLQTARQVPLRGQLLANYRMALPLQP